VGEQDPARQAACGRGASPRVPTHPCSTVQSCCSWLPRVAGAALPFPIPNHNLSTLLVEPPGVGWVVSDHSTHAWGAPPWS
jgi:hypothetical protein